MLACFIYNNTDWHNLAGPTNKDQCRLECNRENGSNWQWAVYQDDSCYCLDHIDIGIITNRMQA